jgi:hypothetical protein
MRVPSGRPNEKGARSLIWRTLALHMQVFEVILPPALNRSTSPLLSLSLPKLLLPSEKNGRLFQEWYGRVTTPAIFSAGSKGWDGTRWQDGFPFLLP